jgi:hypothetical protein
MDRDPRQKPPFSPAKIQYVFIGNVNPGKIRARHAIVLVDIIAREQDNGGKRGLVQPRTEPQRVGFVETCIARAYVDADATRHHPNKGLLPPDSLYPAT